MSRGLLCIGAIALGTILFSGESFGQVTLETPDLTDLDAAQKILDEQGATFQIGHSSASALDLQALAATVVPDNLITQVIEQAALSQRLAAASVFAIQADPELRQTTFADARAVCDPSASSFDWSEHNVISGVQSQGQCGACWAFAAVAALEANFHIVNGTAAPISEQFVLDCAANHGCQGNWFGNAFTVLMAGAPSRTALPYRGVEGICLPNTPSARAVNWSYIGRFGATPADSVLKQALCDHGPIVVALKATPLFKYYKSGVFNENAQGRDVLDVNHAVLLTGWNDNLRTWRIKNSWGPDWGENGFMRIAYRSNNLGVGAAWVEATRIETAAIVEPAVNHVLMSSPADSLEMTDTSGSTAEATIGDSDVGSLENALPLSIDEMLRLEPAYRMQMQ